MATDPRGADHARRDPRGARVPDHVRHRQPAPVQTFLQLPPRLRRLRVHQGTDEGPLQARLGTRWGEDKEDHGEGAGRDAPVLRQHCGTRGRGGLVRPAGLRKVPGPARGRKRGPAVLPGGGLLRSPRALGPATWYVDLYDSDYGGGEPYTPREGSSDYLTPRQLKRMRALYSAEVTMIDRWLGRFLRKMEELELFENT